MRIFKCNPFLRIFQAATTINTEQKVSQLRYNTLLLVASFKFVTILIKTPLQPSSYDKLYSTEIMKVYIIITILPFSRTSWGVGVLNSAIFKLIRMME
jgi:hypothetical protein